MAVTANQVTPRRDGCRASGKLAASTRLYGGSLSFVNSGGYLVDGIAAGANKFAGVMVAEADNSDGANGDVDGEFYSEGDFVLTGSGFTQANVGALAYASDNYTVTATATSMVEIGVFREFISATQMLVSLRRKT